MKYFIEPPFAAVAVLNLFLCVSNTLLQVLIRGPQGPNEVQRCRLESVH